MVEEPTGVDQNGNIIWTERVRKQEIEQACMRENERRFTQASNTPFNIGALGMQMGNTATTKYMDKLLKSTYQLPEGTDPLLQNVIRRLQQGSRREEFPQPGITTAEYQHGWKK